MLLAKTYNPTKQKSVTDSVVNAFKNFFSKSSAGLLRDILPIAATPAKDRIADMSLRPVNPESYASIHDIAGVLFLKTKVSENQN